MGIKFEDTFLFSRELVATLHSRQRLYKRFPELCYELDGLAEPLKSMVRLGEILNVVDTNKGKSLSVQFGDVGLCLKVYNKSVVIATVMHSLPWRAENRANSTARSEERRRERRVRDYLESIK